VFVSANIISTTLDALNVLKRLDSVEESENGGRPNSGPPVKNEYQNNFSSNRKNDGAIRQNPQVNQVYFRQGLQFL
jgi:hypothetical protein